MSAPIVFISYSHDSPAHKEWVLRLGTDLRTRGIDVILDQWDLAAGQDIAAFMESSISRSDRVVIVCTESYIVKSEKGTGGVGYERLIVTGELVARIDTKKFIPVGRWSTLPGRIPKFLGPRMYVDFSSDNEYETRVEDLAREIHGAPFNTKPPLGSNPYTATLPSTDASTARVTGPTGVTQRGESALDEKFFESHVERATAGLTGLGRTGAMEIRAALHDPLRKSQLELLDAVRHAEIRTFGWPIGVLLESREEHRPKPTSEGIVAEVAISESYISGKSSYDYWALRTNGDFVLLQSLFEDERRENSLFFDTRMVRVTETFMFINNLFLHLGAATDSRATVRIAHRGLRGRALTSASRDRYIREITTNEERSEAEVSDTVKGLRVNLVDHVMHVLAPMFMLFDFQQFQRSVYQEVVAKFESGRIS